MKNSIEIGKYIKDSAKRLCENRSLHNFKDHIEKEIIDNIRQEDCLVRLIREITSLLHGSEGNLRIGAAEILGVITPISMADTVKKDSERHLEGHFVRHFVYGGYQGDEEDMRTVSECSIVSINKLTELISGV